MKKRLLTMALMVMALVCVMTMGVGATSVEGISSAQQLTNAFSTGGEYELTSSFSLTTTATVPANTTVTLNLNGFTITGSTSGMTAITNYGDLTIKDSSGNNNGSIICAANSSDSGKPIANYGDLIINGGTYQGYFVLDNSGNLVVNDGVFNAASTSYSTNTVLYNRISSATTEVYGGTFSGQKIVGNTNGSTVIYAGIFTCKTSGNAVAYFTDFIASDSSVVNDNYTYTVTAAQVAEFGGTTYESLAGALSDAESSSGTVTVLANVVIKSSVEIPSGVTLEIGASRIITIASDGGLTIGGTLDNDGIIYNYGTIILEKTQTLYFQGFGSFLLLTCY